jgi:ATP-dependent protease HslVU (ClpYQ) peptidase subunit
VTTVVGLSAPDGVWMAADTMTNVYDRPVAGAVKILRLPAGDDREVLLGFAGNAGMPGLARRMWSVEKSPDDVDDLQEWCDAIATMLTGPMVEAGMVGEEGQLDGNFLLGVPGWADGMTPTLWTIGHHMAIRLPDGRGAVGSGEGPAMGALDAMLLCGSEPPVAVARACQIAISRCRWSDGPIRVESIPAR